MPKAKTPTTPSLKEALGEGLQTAPETVSVLKADQQRHDVKVVPPIIKNTRGEDVDVADYFYAPAGEKPIAPPFFNKAIGKPTDREDLIEIFDKVFKPEDNFVLLKAQDKEVYSVLVPLKYTEIGEQEDSVLGDYQIHGMSFIQDGSVNYDKFKTSLAKVAQLIKYNNR